MLSKMIFGLKPQIRGDSFRKKYLVHLKTSFAMATMVMRLRKCQVAAKSFALYAAILPAIVS